MRARAATQDGDPVDATEIVAEVGDRIVGSVVLWRESASTFYVTRLFAEIPFRRRGIGRQLIDACQERARIHGNAKIRVTVGESNLAARAFFCRLGFQF
jgi:ribosomal protein S18 acetylase RimI-like enzyme